MSAIRTLLAESIDYAGLFPPAGLDMGTAVENYARYSAGPWAWALGRFIVSVNQLPELEYELGRIPVSGDRPWRGAALLGADHEADVKLLDAFNRRHQDAADTDRYRRGESYLRTRGRRDHQDGAVSLADLYRASGRPRPDDPAPGRGGAEGDGPRCGPAESPPMPFPRRRTCSVSSEGRSRSRSPSRRRRDCTTRSARRTA